MSAHTHTHAWRVPDGGSGNRADAPGGYIVSVLVCDCGYVKERWIHSISRTGKIRSCIRAPNDQFKFAATSLILRRAPTDKALLRREQLFVAGGSRAVKVADLKAGWL